MVQSELKKVLPFSMVDSKGLLVFLYNMINLLVCIKDAAVFFIRLGCLYELQNECDEVMTYNLFKDH